MIRKYVLFLFLFLIPVAFAQEENFNNYSSLEIDVSIESIIDINYIKESSMMDFLEIKLGIFPREDNYQKIKIKNIFSDPESEIRENDVISFKWEDVKDERLKYGLNATVSIDNEFAKISNKVVFPIKDIDSNVMEYMRFSEFIDINDEIRNKASEIVEGETDMYVATYKLADWVKSNVKYNLTTLTADAVQKSSWVFSNKQGVCDELTNLFISMARSVGIPARFVAGAVYTNLYYDFGNHGWAEVYFPGYGWIPFDVTFGQYGWVDPGHVKLVESFDYGKSNAVAYTWKSRDVDVDPKALNVKSLVKSKKGSIRDFANIEIKPIKQRVGFGSFVPIEVIVENKNNFYLPISLHITKAPGLLEERDIFSVLRPREKRNFYWIAKIPEDLNDKFIYTSFLEVRTNFNEIFSGEIKYSSEYESYGLLKAQRFVDNYREINDKEIFTDVKVECIKDKEVYYERNNAKVDCEIKNKGNVNLRDVNVCLYDQCRIINLRLAESRNVSFEHEVFESGSLDINVVFDGLVKSENLELKVVKIPLVDIKYIGNDSFDYNKMENITLEISSNSLVKNVTLDINGNKIQLKDFEGRYKVDFAINTKDMSDKIKFKLNYLDEIEKDYELEKEQEIKIVNVPWHSKIIDSIKDFFSNF